MVQQSWMICWDVQGGCLEGCAGDWFPVDVWQILFRLQGQTQQFTTFGEEGDISNICNFGWYKWVHFRETTAAFPYQAHVLGCCHGPAKNESSELKKGVLKQNGQSVPTEAIRLIYWDFLSLLKKKIGSSPRRTKMMYTLSCLLMR